jgi:hypothetical protein
MCYSCSNIINELWFIRAILVIGQAFVRIVLQQAIAQMAEFLNTFLISFLQVFPAIDSPRDIFVDFNIKTRVKCDFMILLSDSDRDIWHISFGSRY